LKVAASLRTEGILSTIIFIGQLYALTFESVVASITRSKGNHRDMENSLASSSRLNHDHLPARQVREAGAEAYFTKKEGAEWLQNYLLFVKP
jgi:hypothetical protein